MDRRELDDVLALAESEARRYLAALDEGPLHVDADGTALMLAGRLPEEGVGALAALAELVGDGFGASVAAAGPRFFHFVTGGVTPAALAADWLTSTLDQNAFSWVGSPLASRLESLALEWLRDLFRLPEGWGGVLTTGATAANFVALGAARRWWGDRHGADVDRDGLTGLPRVPVLTSGYVHATARKALGMLGIGRESVRVLARDRVGRLDRDALAAALARLDGAPAIVIANAGEVNAGDFDPIAEMADLAERHDAWLHVDGAFGLFARVTPEAAPLVDGVERAHSVIADGHKWLNVPYDCGFAFLRNTGLLPPVFSASAAYLPEHDPLRPSFGLMTPESSQRARSLPVWATLRAYGRTGYREMVERHLALARRIAERVDAAPDLERLAEVPLNIVCFRFRPPDLPEEKLDGLNARLGEAVLADGRVYTGTTRYDGKVAFRPAIVNWRTREEDVDVLVEVIRELGSRLARAEPAPPVTPTG
ncbi:MAG: pyridoxal-dependent decarboxylase [Actinomycetota bacterium]|nr:pyridoxal-dependent decarboxylase [Actinomycetota bacterium]